MVSYSSERVVVIKIVSCFFQVYSVFRSEEKCCNRKAEKSGQLRSNKPGSLVHSPRRHAYERSQFKHEKIIYLCRLFL